MGIDRRFFLAIWALCLFPCLCLAREVGGLVVDQAGREVRVPDHPERVISLAPSLTEIVIALGCGNLLVGATTYSDYPDEAKRLPRVGSYAQPDVERILVLRPDICLAVADMTPRTVIDRLTALGVPVYCLDITNLNAVLDSIQKVGQVLNAVDKANMLTRDMRRRMDRVGEAFANAGKPSVLYQIGVAPMYAACKDTFINELIDIAGGRNVCASMSGYPMITREMAVSFMPEVILIPTMGRDQFEAARAQWARWPEVPAVRDGRIFLLDSDLYDRPGPRIPQGLEELARLLHDTPSLQADTHP